MITASHRSRPLAAFTSVACLALLVSCGKEEPAAPVNNTAPTNQAAPSQPAQTPASSESIEATSPVNQTAGLTWDVPNGWGSITPDGLMRKAQYAAPAPEGSAAESAECVVYYFGPAGQGGDAESNVQRWSQQVLDEQGAPAEPARMEFNVGDLKVTTVAYVGSYLSGMPGGPQTPMPDSMLLGAIIEGGPEGSIFIKMTGPADVVDAHREAWEMMVRSFRPAS
jgi:hypothetical protein